MSYKQGNKAKSFEILLVEDNPADIRLIREAFRGREGRHQLSVVKDGEEALQFLRRHGQHLEAQRPDVILLDLNLPKKDGREVLKEIKTDVTLRNIPVVIMSTSADEKDIRRSYDLHANCYVTKPVDFDDFVGVMCSIEQFWLDVVVLPEGGTV